MNTTQTDYFRTVARTLLEVRLKEARQSVKEALAEEAYFLDCETSMARTYAEGYLDAVRHLFTDLIGNEGAEQ